MVRTRTKARDYITSQERPHHCDDELPSFRWHSLNNRPAQIGIARLSISRSMPMMFLAARALRELSCRFPQAATDREIRFLIVVHQLPYLQRRFH